MSKKPKYICQICEAKLKVESEEGKIIVTPCTKCKKNSFTIAYNNGYDDGYDKGYEDGYERGSIENQNLLP